MSQHKRDSLMLLPLLGFIALFAAAADVLIDQHLDAPAVALLAAGLSCIAVFIVLRLPRLSPHLTPITTGFGYVILLLILMILANLAASRFFLRLDLTELRGYSLSEQTLNSLGNLAEPVQISAFLRPTDYRSRLAEKLLGEYADHCPWIIYEVIDPDGRPSAMQQKGVSRYGTLLFEKGPKRLEINSVDEQSITSAILRLSEERLKNIYFLTGHGERDIESGQRTGYRLLAWHLRNKGNFVLKTLSFTASATFPEDVDVLIIPSPRSSFSSRDEDLVTQYLDNGGRLLLLLDAGVTVPFSHLLPEWGVHVGENLVFDPVENYFGDAATPMINKYEPSSITRSLQGMSTFFPLAREVSPSQTIPEGLIVRSLVKTSTRSWAETNLKGSEASFDDGEDKPGPVSLAVSIQASLAAGRGASAAKSRLVVFGDSDFVSNAALSSTNTDSGNVLLFLSAVDWLIENDSLINLSPIDTTKQTLILSARQMRLVAYTTMLFIPLLIALTGTLVWWRRHR